LRDDAAYDIVIVLGHNDAPPAPGMGSAIFWHVWVLQEDGSPKGTEGCIAISRAEMERILPLLEPGMRMEIA
jgi:L,D-peptidoglycan transpeptidase YkuD (ErfK/YbiS/YcfS/YnhG family)